MSVIFGSGKAAAARLQQGSGASKKKTPKKLGRPRTAIPVDSYMPSDDTAVWNTEIKGVKYSIALIKESEDLWANDQLVATRKDFSDNGSNLDFMLNSHNSPVKGHITIDRSSSVPSYALTLDGKRVEAAVQPRLNREKTRSS